MKVWRLLVFALVDLGASSWGTVATAAIEAGVRYEVIGRRELPPFGNRVLEVRLETQVSVDVLRAIAMKLKSAVPPQSGHLFIMYYLPDMRIGGGAWATSHFTPRLEVNIIGMSAAEEAKLTARVETKAGQLVIGVWLDKDPVLPGRITIYEKAGRTYFSQTWRDGSVTTREATRSETTSRGTRFELKDANTASQYYLLNNRRDLQLWDKDGLVSTARRLKN